MENHVIKTPIWQQLFKYAIIYSFAFISFQLILFVISIEPEKFKWLVFFINISISFIVLYISLLNIRNEHFEGYINYGKAISIGSLLLLIASPLMAFWTYIYFAFIDSETIKSSIELSKKQIIEKGGSEDQISASLDMLNLFTSPPALVIFSFIGTFFMGFISLLIIAAFVKKIDPDNTYKSLDN
jgi:hypothetical protein